MSDEEDCIFGGCEFCTDMEATSGAWSKPGSVQEVIDDGRKAAEQVRRATTDGQRDLYLVKPTDPEPGWPHTGKHNDKGSACTHADLLSRSTGERFEVVQVGSDGDGEVVYRTSEANDARR